MEDMLLNDLVHLENILDGNSQPTGLKLSLLEYMTDNFSEEREIGRGAFGVVYKGEFRNRTIAVKKLTFTNNTEKDFDREIQNLMMVSHQNIVRFLGYCDNTKVTYMKNAANPGEPERFSGVYNQERIICFEYISNGSLTQHIHDELRGLEWHTRYKIIREICLALHYLHDKKNMVHRDLKPDNILVDNLMVPKIADLGISKLLEDGASKAMTTNSKMSWGYAAPEFKDRLVSFKYDIYSLGVIIIELVTGVTKKPDIKNVLTRWRHRWNKSNETLRYRQVAKCIEIGLSCKNDNPKKRPFISKIIKELYDVDGGNGADGQVIPCWNNLLWVEPPELFFPFQINKQMSCSLELNNETDAYMAFFVKSDSDFQYHVDPNIGIIQPRSHFSVNITLQPQEEAPEKMRNSNEFTIKSKKVNEGLKAEDLTKENFSKMSGDIVDKLRIGVVFDAQERAKCCISEEHLSLKISTRSTAGLIMVNPLEFCFPSEQKEVKLSLQIVNITDNYVAFNLAPQHNMGNYTIPLPIGVLSPQSMLERVIKRFADVGGPTDVQCKEVVIVQSTTVSNGLEERDITYDMFQTKMGRMVQQVELSFVPIPTSRPQPVAFTSDDAWTIDMHPTVPLILLTMSLDYFQMWNYQTQDMRKIAIPGTKSFQTKNKMIKKAIFIPHMQWMVASTDGGLIYVLSYDPEVKLIHTLHEHVGDTVWSLAIHATEPYMVSASDKGKTVLWNYEKNWEIMNSFDAHCHHLVHVAFNPKMTNMFATANYRRIQIWDIYSKQPKHTFVHSNYMRRSDFFIRDDKQYLISSSDEGTAKIWDFSTEKCVQTLEGHSKIQKAVCHPDLPVIITGSLDGAVYLWNSTNFRLKRILKFGRKQVTDIACIKGSTRIAIAFRNGIVLADIGPEGPSV